MAITRIKNSGIKTGVLKYDNMLAGNAAYIPSSFESIASATGTGSSATITFSSIPSTYQHLQIRWISKSLNNADVRQNVRVRFNSDTGSNYASHELYGDGATALADSASSVTSVNLVGAGLANGSSLTNMLGAGILDIHDYTSTAKYKTLKTFYGNGTNIADTGYAVRLASGLWMSTSAITTITFESTSNNFTTTTQFALYGIKA